MSDHAAAHLRQALYQLPSLHLSDHKFLDFLNKRDLIRFEVHQKVL